MNKEPHNHDWLSYMLLALIVIVILMVIYHNYSEGANAGITRKRVRDNIKMSAGGFDTYAKHALAELEGMKSRNATDAYTMGTLLEFNMLGGEITNAPRATVTAIASAYTETMERAAAQMMQRIVQAREEPVGGAIEPVEPTDPPIEFMIAHIEQFTDNDFANIVEDDMLDDETINALFTRAAETIPMIRETNREIRRVNARTHTNNREDATHTYMGAARTFTSDPQNVHESHVNEDLRATLMRIEQSARTDTTLTVRLSHAQEFILNSELSPDARTRACKSLEIVGKNQYIGTLQCTEGHVFGSVWDRAEDPANVVNENLIKLALANALADFWENGISHSPVCINGRCSRMLASLVLLDYDNSVGNVQTKEMIKNEIIDAATTIIDESVEAACVSANEKRRTVGESYRNPKITADEAEELKFIDEMKAKISNMMEHNYRDKLSPRDWTNIRDDIYAGISA